METPPQNSDRLSLAKKIYVGFLMVALITAGIVIYKNRDDSPTTVYRPPESSPKSGQEMWKDAVDRNSVKVKDVAQSLREADARRAMSTPRPVATPSVADILADEKIREEIGTLSDNPLKNRRLQDQEIERRKAAKASAGAAGQTRP